MPMAQRLLLLLLASLMVASQTLAAAESLSPAMSSRVDDIRAAQLAAPDGKQFCTQGVILPPVVSFCCIDFPIDPDPGFDPANVCTPCSSFPFNDYQWWANNVGLHVEVCGNLRPCLEDPNTLEFCVEGAVPAEPSTWGKIKATYRD